MPKYTIEFHHDEEAEFQMCNQAHDYWNALFDLDQWLRNKLKYEEINEEQYKAFEEVRNELYQKLNEYNINL
jgi:hypothetical protein